MPLPSTPLSAATSAALRWSGLAMATTVVLRLGLLAALGRLLSPEDFGLVGILLVSVGLVQTLADMGLTGAIISRARPTPDELSTLFWLNGLVGLGLFGLFLLGGPLAANLFGESRLAVLWRVAALRLLLQPLGTPALSMLQKDLRFGTLAGIQLATAFLGSAVSLCGALSGWGVVALLVGDLSSAALQSLLATISLRRTWLPRFHLRLAEARGYLSFGAYQTAERMLGALYSNLDNLLLGHFCGAPALGPYSVAFEASSLPVRYFNPVVTSVALPVLSTQRHEPTRLQETYSSVVELVCFVGFPVLCGLGAAAATLVPVALGSRWTESVLLFQVLVLAGLLRVVANPMGPLFVALGRADLSFRWALAATSMNVVVFAWTAQAGALVLAWSWVALLTVQLAALFALGHALGGFRTLPLLRRLAPTAGLAAAMAALAWVLETSLPHYLSDGLRALLIVLASAIFYAWTNWRFNHPVFARFLHLLRPRGSP